MDKLLFPPFESRIKKINGKTAIFDIIRKKFIVITPEEWVRQHLIHFLINQMKYPKSLFLVEDGMKVHKMIKRSDVVIYNRKGEIFLAVECKSTRVKLTQKSMDQLSVYNQHYKADYLVLTNGLQLYICKMDYTSGNSEFIDQFPEFA
jgi:hypothetical protein